MENCFNMFQQLSLSLPIVNFQPQTPILQIAQAKIPGIDHDEYDDDSVPPAPEPEDSSSSSSTSESEIDGMDIECPQHPDQKGLEIAATSLATKTASPTHGNHAPTATGPPSEPKPAAEPEPPVAMQAGPLLRNDKVGKGFFRQSWLILWTMGINGDPWIDYVLIEILVLGGAVGTDVLDLLARAQQQLAVWNT